jgi:hypothetical protein
MRETPANGDLMVAQGEKQCYIKHTLTKEEEHGEDGFEIDVWSKSFRSAGRY